MTTLAFTSTSPGLAPSREKSAVDYLLLALVSVLLHFCVWLWFQQPRERPTPVTPPRVLQLSLQRLAPLPVVPPPPLPVIEPPPVVTATPPPKPKLKPRPTPKPAPKPKPPPPLAPPAPAPVVPPPAVTTPASAAALTVPAPEPVIVPASTRATSRRNPKPDYPTLAKRRGWQGKVLLEVEVLSDGTPGKIQVAASSGREVLDNAAIKAVKRWLFEPARRDNTPISTTLNLSIVFKLEQ
jgi:periplasmic protein TonB